MSLSRSLLSTLGIKQTLSSCLRSRQLIPSRYLSSPTVQRDDLKRVLSVAWGDGTKSFHPFTWLKDSCPCEACAHPVTLNRRVTLQPLDLKCIPEVVSFNDERSEMTIMWNDAHESVYPYGWLIDRCFSKPKKEHKSLVTTWGKEFQPKRFDWTTVIENEHVLLDFIVTLKTVGVCIISGAPNNDDGLNKLIDALGMQWSSNYGDYFDVIIKNDPSHIAYTTEIIAPHTDLPYYKEPPGIQFLHSVMKTSDVVGGENQLVDGFYVAEMLRREDPEAFQILCDYPIHYWDYGSDFLKDFHFQLSQKVIEVDDQGNVYNIIFSSHFRDSKPCVPLEKADLFYRAIKKFHELLMQESISHDPCEGEMFVVNNHRVLHGRSSYQVTGNGARHARETYMTWDTLNSRLRRLQAKLTNNN